MPFLTTMLKNGVRTCFALPQPNDMCLRRADALDATLRPQQSFFVFVVETLRKSKSETKRNQEQRLLTVIWQAQ